MRAALVAFVAACASVPPPAAPAASAGALSLLEASTDLDGTVVVASDARATIAVVFASWCGHCRHELDLLAGMRAAHPGARILGVNYRGHEEYAERGSPEAVRSYVAEHAPWLRVVPAGEPLFSALGRPPKIPFIVIYDRSGKPVAHYDRLERPPPSADELAAVLRALGA